VADPVSDGPAGAAAAGGASKGAAAGAADHLRERVAEYLRAHHTMTVATMGPLPVMGAGASPGGALDFGPVAPHAASVFYAVDDDLRLIFLSKSASTHGLHIGKAAPVAVTVTEQYDDWEDIRGVQLWGVAKRVTGPARVLAMASYLRRFPFVDDLLEQPRLATAMRGVSVYRVEPQRVALTDNTTGVFGREILDLKG
jgi:uncharacterized protein YhbP (UPF0306 family)